MSLSNRHYPALDGIRALAILIVIPHNVNILNVGSASLMFPVVAFAHAGWVGVQLFFVLSGFLITGALLDSQDSKNYYASFFWRRALRILPLYYVVLLLALVVIPAFFALPRDLEATRHNAVWLWTFLSNWTQPYGAGVHGFAHFWSLAVEEQFYLLWPFIVRRNTPASLLRLCFAICVAALTARSIMELTHFPHEALYTFTVCRMDALALGAAAAAALRVPAIRTVLETKISLVALLAFSLLALNALVTHAYGVYDNFDQTLGYLFLAMGFALMILPAILPAQGTVRSLYAVLGWRPLRLIGRYSYAMYVFHFPLHIFWGEPMLRELAAPPSPLIAVGYALGVIAVSFALAALSYYLFERHFLSLKSYFLPRANEPLPHH